MKYKSIIFGIKGLDLTLDEIDFLKKERPWGIILFSRNIFTLHQTRRLISKIKKITKNKNFPILIDQEGGKISRLNRILNLSFFSQRYFAEIYNQHRNIFNSYYKNYINEISNILNFLGININTVPVLDIIRKNTHKIIGSRSFSENPKIVAVLGNKCIQNFAKNKIATVIKHIPGHGLSTRDTHNRTGVVNRDKKYLENNDFVPFKHCNTFFAMTAHIIYRKIDPYFTATHSKKIIEEIIRKKIGFKGIIISDDISMKSLKYSLKENTTKALDAGCNLILHCNGKMNEMKKLAKIVPEVDNLTKIKTSQFNEFLR